MPPRASTIFNAGGVDRLRVQIGLPPTVRSRDTVRAAASPLSSELQRICQPDDVQAAFLRQEIHPDLASTCRANSVARLMRDFLKARQEIVKPSSLDRTIENLGILEQALLCPLISNGLTPAILRISQEKMADLALREVGMREAFRHLSCSMAWRGLKWNMMSPKAKGLLDVESP